MKHLFTTLLLGAALLPFAACNKKAQDEVQPANTVNPLAMAKGGSGGGGGTTTPAGPIQNFLTGTAGRLVGTHTDSMFVSFTQPVPAGGYRLTVSSNSTSAQVPATVTAPAGAYNVGIPVTGANVTATQSVTVTVSLGGQTKSNTIKVYPLNYTFAAPSLQSPGNGSSFGYHRFITFQWASNANAYFSEIQVSPNTSFSVLNHDAYSESNIYPADYFDGTGVRYWRVRYIDGAGNAGPWSAVRSFTVKPQ